MTEVDFRCYFVTGAGAPDQIVETARAAAQGGAGIIQVRSKPVSARDLYDLGLSVVTAVHEVNPDIRVLIDDRVDIALALKPHGVAGVHIGQDDLNPRIARDLLGHDAIIGLTTGTLDLVEAANDFADVIDYIGAGPFRDTPTKDSGRTPLGLDGYPALVEASKLPIVAIGDVTVDDAEALARTGVDGVAIVRGIMNADNPRDYVEHVIANVDRGRL
ncbi:thiamine phosphate synthase [Corynebacterium appendicis]|uniref:thiamine phosphate synthase n=1 Tax=Corynebacterium appendicis TaxID=163202 RepID=UPI00254D73ED|nr:thiamine phosphate synthase [Corynebacterium appendicis]MDK8625599.1 thiamine phosphate synthase [Corynebacterium appendicis]